MRLIWVQAAQFTLYFHRTLDIADQTMLREF